MSANSMTGLASKCSSSVVALIDKNRIRRRARYSFLNRRYCGSFITFLAANIEIDLHRHAHGGWFDREIDAARFLAFILALRIDPQIGNKQGLRSRWIAFLRLHDTCASQARPRGQAALPRPGHTGSTASRWLPVPAQRRSLAAPPVLRAVTGTACWVGAGAGGTTVATTSFSTRWANSPARACNSTSAASMFGQLSAAAIWEEACSCKAINMRYSRRRMSRCASSAPAAVSNSVASRKEGSPDGITARQNQPFPGCGQGSKVETALAGFRRAGTVSAAGAPGAHVPGAEPQAPTHRSPPTVPAAKLSSPKGVARYVTYRRGHRGCNHGQSSLRSRVECASASPVRATAHRNESSST